MPAARSLTSRSHHAPWGGVAGIFEQFTVQAGLGYEVALPTRNAADALTLQRIAAQQLGFAVPEPGTLALAGLALRVALGRRGARAPRSARAAGSV